MFVSFLVTSVMVKMLRALRGRRLTSSVPTTAGPPPGVSDKRPHVLSVQTKQEKLTILKGLHGIINKL